ncbi:MAG: hypothetical protein N3A63_08260 [Bacteroidetes bacterium]|nr:hypothetical protein [Bacteroidota bacterium]
MGRHQTTTQLSTISIDTTSPLLWVVLGSVVVCFGIFPFLTVQFIPITDLPQHLAQIRLFYDILSSPHNSPFAVTWFSANVLVYWILALLWLILPPLGAGTFFMILLVLSWILSIYFLAWKTHRNPFPAVLASTLVFNASLYWGFINFLIGFPLFVLWCVYVLCPTKQSSYSKHSAITFLLSVGLFLAHALWFAVALVSLLLVNIRRKFPLKMYFAYIVGIAPIVLYAVIWFPSLAETRSSLKFDTSAHWIFSPIERLHPLWIINSIYGGLKNPVEWIVVLIVCGWIVLSLLTNRKDLRTLINWDMFRIASFLLTIVYLAPEKYVNTIYFASRWYPMAVLFFIIALPTPKINTLVQLGTVVGAFIVLTVVTTISWRMFERYENTGLKESLATIPWKARILGLDFVKESQILCGRPFLQTFAYAQVFRNAELNFSFALHQSGIVRLTDTTIAKQWTPGLEWFAERVRFEDFDYFDYALINAPEDLHNALTMLPLLKQITTTGRWRLYKCIHNTGLKGPVFKISR